MNAMNMATCSFPEPQRFDSYAEYRSAFAAVILAAQHELLLCEQDFSQCDFGSKVIREALWAFFAANPPGKMRLIAFNSNYLTNNCQSFLQLKEKFSHRIELRIANDSCNSWHQGFILADRHCLLRRHHFNWPRGEITTDSGAVAVMQQQFNDLWENSDTNSDWQRLYL